MPLLITENFGRGRTAVLATSGTWRWQMNLPVGDPAFTLFWQQLLRWLVTGSPGHVTASVPNQVLLDDGRVALSVDVRDDDYQPVADARVEAHIIGPGGVSASLDMTPVPDAPGSFQAEWTADTARLLSDRSGRATRGQQPIGRDVLTFQRMDGVAENFHTDQNRELLTRLASQTGGRYWRPQDLSDLPDEIAFSEAGVTTRETRELWNMPVVSAGDRAAALRRVAAAPEVGHRMRRVVEHWPDGTLARDACARRGLLRHRRRPRRRSRTTSSASRRRRRISTRCSRPPAPTCMSTR